MLLEDFIVALKRPLTALQFINDVLDEKIELKWGFLQEKTRKQAEYLYTMILINKYIIHVCFTPKIL